MDGQELGEVKRVRVLVCDDSETERQFLVDFLAEYGQIDVVGQAVDGAEAVALALERSPDVVLMDVEMPSADGISATRTIRQHLPAARIVAITAHEEPDSVLAMIEAGANAYVIKGGPVSEQRRAIAEALFGSYLDGRVVPTVLGSIVRLYRVEREARASLAEANRELARDAEKLRSLTRGIAVSLAAAVEARDGITGDHVHRVAILTRTLAEQVAPELLEGLQLDYGPLLHDIGKLGMDDAVLRKPGPLTAEEQVEMRRHVAIGVQILEPIPGFESVCELVLCHHERWDGAGYPRGLRGEEIPLAARIFAVCDSFDAMTSDRPYRSALPKSEALDEIEAQADRQFDPQIAQAFVRLVVGGAVSTRQGWAA